MIAGRSSLVGAFAALALLAGCARPASSDPGRFYARPQSVEEAERTRVVLIPGIPDIPLVEADGGVVWDPAAGLSPAAGDDPALPALPMRPGAPLDELLDGLRPASGALSGSRRRSVRRRAGGASVDLLTALRLGGYRPDEPQVAGAAMGGTEAAGAGPPNVFRFDYDWRRDLVESAASLHRFLLERRAEARFQQRQSAIDRSKATRFDIVADASGGLLLRYYLRYGDADLPADGSLPPLTWAGGDLVERAILVAPPNAGGVGALLDLVGAEEGSATLRGVSPAVLGTWPSIYQLLPRGRHASVMRIQNDSREVIGDTFEPALWENLGWGLASSEAEALLARLLPLEADPVARRRIALDHLRKCLVRARRFCEALDVPGHPPPGLTLHLLAADTVPTDAVAGIDWTTGRLRVIERRPGDGVVLRSSALLDERIGARWSPSLLSPIDWNSVMFFHADGDTLRRDPAFSDNLLFLLLEQPRRSSD